MTWDPLLTTVGLHDSAADADALVQVEAARMLGASAEQVQVGRLCPRCGSSAHGRPWARIAGAGRDGEVAVSISRAGPHLLIAVSRRERVGADIEEEAAVDARWDPSIVLHADEAETGVAPAAVWSRKEAILKMLGVGLDAPMPSIRMADHEVHDLPAPAGFRAALALR